MVIATGSNNSSRYFEYYFGKYPNIIRKNRNSIAIIEGDETEAELEKPWIRYFSLFWTWLQKCLKNIYSGRI